MDQRIKLEFKGIVKNFPGQKALDGMNFTLREREIHALLGHNGAGKSTLIKIMAGLYEKDEGQIILDGQLVEIKNPHQADELGLSFIHQELGLVPNFNTLENLMLGLSYPLNGFGLIDWSATQEMIRPAVETMDFRFDLKRPVKELSISDQWLVSIGRALVKNSRILVLDEPTAALTKDEIDRLFETLRRLRETGTSIIYISHRLNEVFELADRATVMKAGAAVGTRLVKDLDENGLVEMMVGARIIQRTEACQDEARGEPILSVRNLRGGEPIRDVSFDVHGCEILGLAGLVGAKRTEIFKLVFGAQKKEGGRILIRGREVEISSPQEAIRHGLAMIPEDRREEGLIQDMPVSMNITLAHLSLNRLFKRLPLISPRQEYERTRLFTDMLDIQTTGPTQKVRFLSGGNQQKVVLSKWLCDRAQVYIFDEPTVGIDVGTKEQIYGLIRKLANKGAGVVVISSDFKELTRLSDRTLVVREGVIVGELSAEQNTEENILFLCYSDQAPGPSGTSGTA